MDLKAAVKAYQENPERAQAVERKMQELLARSATDVVFRKKLLNDPHAALAEFTGRPVDSKVNIVFVENKADATVVLPPAVDPAAELSEQELEAVAGGISPVLTVIASVLWSIAETIDLLT